MRWHTMSVAIALAGLATPKTTSWSWRGEAPPGRVVEVRLARGSVRVEQVEGREVELAARLIGRRDDPEGVRMELHQEEGWLEISAVYPAKRLPGRGALPVNPETGNMECLPEDPRGDFWYSDVRVDLVVRVPAGVLVRAEVLDGQVNGPASLLGRPKAAGDRRSPSGGSGRLPRETSGRSAAAHTEDRDVEPGVLGSA